MEPENITPKIKGKKKQTKHTNYMQIIFNEYN